ncbi:hypothetical protein KM043_011677 [Ampulex compressa]|nr:hypothetical protein KM043_011677 [Ampulex compressa]
MNSKYKSANAAAVSYARLRPGWIEREAPGGKGSGRFQGSAEVNRLARLFDPRSRSDPAPPPPGRRQSGTSRFGHSCRTQMNVQRGQNARVGRIPNVFTSDSAREDHGGETMGGRQQWPGRKRWRRGGPSQAHRYEMERKEGTMGGTGQMMSPWRQQGAGGSVQPGTI